MTLPIFICPRCSSRKVKPEESPSYLAGRLILATCQQCGVGIGVELVVVDKPKAADMVAPRQG